MFFIGKKIYYTRDQYPETSHLSWLFSNATVDSSNFTNLLVVICNLSDSSAFNNTEAIVIGYPISWIGSVQFYNPKHEASSHSLAGIRASAPGVGHVVWGRREINNVRVILSRLDFR